MTDELVILRTDNRGARGTVATISFNNARRMNALGTAEIRAFTEIVTKIGEDPDLRAVIVTGEGPRAFVGGANLHELGKLDPPKAREFLTLIHRMSKSLRDLPVPVIARVNGICIGAGLELMAACDMQVAADTAVFGMPEVKVGLPSVVEAALLPQLVGWARAKVLLYTGDNIDAKTALEWGLVQKVLPLERLDEGVEQWVSSIVESGPKAIRLQKELIREWEAMSVSDAIEAGIRSIYRAYQSDEPARLVGAALDRLKARRK